MTCSIEARVVEEGAGVVRRRSRLSLVDLAGSERQKVSDTEGERLKEAQAINLSLFHLIRVVQILNEHTAASTRSKAAPPPHVPYADSALTVLLADALGGNSKTIMICAISPSAVNYEESMSTLRYADRAKKIQNKAVINESV